MKNIRLLLFLLIFSLTLNACRQTEEVQVLATNSWTAAYVRLAGFEEVQVLAPAAMQHPTEYELNIEDIRKIRQARLIVNAGYEVMMDRVRTGLDVEQERLITIKTGYSMEAINRSVMAIADRLGTQDEARHNLEALAVVFENARQEIRSAGLDESKYLVQHFLQPLAEELDLEITGVFGPGHLEAFNIRELMQQPFDIILDNAHNPVAKPLEASSEGVDVVYLLNFPGMHGTRSLEDVVRYNTRQILDVRNELP